MLLRKIPLQQPQQFPENWESTFIGIGIPSEDDLLRADWMGDSSYNKISGNFNTEALVYAAMHAFDITTIPTIKLHRRGGWNNIFLIDFPDGRKVVARIPNQSGRLPHRVESTVATMAMAHYHHRIPVPEIYAWHGNNENPVGAPYMLLEWVEGIEPWQNWYELPAESRTVLLDELARYHEVFAQPMPWQTLGSIVFADGLSMNDANLDLSDASTYQIGPFIPGPSCTEYRCASIHPAITHTSIIEFWIQLLKDEVDSVIATYGDDRSAIIITADHPHHLIQKSYTLGQFLDTADDLSKIINHCPLPSQPELYQPCFVTTDYAFRNIILKDVDTLKVSFFLDWDDVYVLPFFLCSRFPEDICCLDGAGGSWEATGAFRFLPPDEEPQDVSKDDLGENNDIASLEKQVEVGGNEEDEDARNASSRRHSPSLSSSLSESESGSEGESFPQYSIIAPEIPEEETERLSRVENTCYRREYMALLAKYDTRYATEGLWTMREDPLKVQYLVTHGWVSWLTRTDWLRKRAKELTAGKTK